MSGTGLRIAFVGSHSTGKTTIARPVAERLGLPFLSEVAREVAREWGLTPVTVPPERAVEYQWEILRKQIEGERKHGLWVSDRSTVDNCAYFDAYAASKTTPLDASTYRLRAWDNTTNYTHLILIPPMFAPVDDGERHTDPIEQMRIHDVVCELIDAWGLWGITHTVRSNTPETRIDEILEVLGAVHA